jgi:hypothetical protein
MATIKRSETHEPRFEQLFAAHDAAAPRTWTGTVTVEIIGGKAVSLSAKRESDYPPRS